MNTQKIRSALSAALVIACLAAVPASAQTGEFSTAVTAFNSGQYPQAADMLVQYLRQNPQDALAHYYLAVTWHCLGRAGEAQNEYSWVKSNSTDPELQKRADMGLQVVSRVKPVNQAVAPVQPGMQQPATAYSGSGSGYQQQAPSYGQAYGQPNAAYGQAAGYGQPNAQAGYGQPNAYAQQAGYGGYQPAAPYQPYNGGYQQPGAYSAYQPQTGTGYQPAAAEYGAPGAGTTGWLSPAGAQQAVSASGGAVPNVGMQGKIIDLYTSWCGWCKRFEPIFMQAQSKYSSVLQFQRLNAEVSPNTALVKKYHVRGYPTILLLDNSGKLVKRIDGAPQSLPEFEQTIFAAYPSLAAQ